MQRSRYFLFVLCTLLLFNVPIFSSNDVENENILTLQETVYNEYDFIKILIKSNYEDLCDLKITESEAKVILAEYNKKLLEISQLPQYKLKGLGYTDAQIDVLKSYQKGEILSEHELRGISGTCTGTIKLKNCGTKYAKFYYEWTWDHAPIITASDSFAMRWLAYDNSGHEFDIIRTGISSEINYYWFDTFKFTKSGEEEVGLDFNSTNIQFNVIETFNNTTGIPDEAYAKNGKVQVNVQVDSSVSTDINYIKIAALYGHTTVGLNFPSLSVSPGSISISFSGNFSIDKVAGKKAKIMPPSKIENLD